MKYREDLTGQRFGQLVVIEAADDYVSPGGQSRPRWRCLCDCGHEAIFEAYKLKNGAKTHCPGGWHRADLVGQHFGEWTVIKDDGTRAKANAVKWLCRCSCGNFGHVTTALLRSGASTSCGHKSLPNLVMTEEHHLSMLGDKPPVTNTTGERNISITIRNGIKWYRVAVVFERKQHGGLYRTMERAIAARERLRKKYWPNYDKD